MKLFFLFSVILVGIYASSVESIQNNDDGKIKTKRNIETSAECKYINRLYDEDESYNCCEINGIHCRDGHVVET